MPSDHIREVRIVNFKAFRQFTLRTPTSHFLAGPNNAGKSSLVTALRLTAYLLRISQNRRPNSSVRHGSFNGFGYTFSPERAGVNDTNIRNEFNQVESSVTVRFRQSALTAVWPEPEFEEGRALPVTPYFYLTRTDHPQPSTPTEIRSSFPSVGVIPTLSPLVPEEAELTEQYVRDEIDSRLASSHFRNQLYLLSLGRLVVGRESQEIGQLEEFRQFCAPWIPEIHLDAVSVSGSGRDRRVFASFVEPGRGLPKDMSWAGDGIQVWLQLLLHIFIKRNSDCLILDEPELFLHADLQRRLVRLLGSLGAQTITASHSMEVLGEASSDSIIYIDKSRVRGVRTSSEQSLMEISQAVQSQFNLGLAKALRSRAVLCVEGNDMQIVTRLSRTLQAVHVADEIDIAVLPIGGFENWDRIEPFKWLTDHFLSSSVKMFVTLDRDYRSEDHLLAIESTLSSWGIDSHIWRRKELESYLLEVSVLARLTTLPEERVLEILSAEADLHRSYVIARMQDREHERARADRSSTADAIQTVLDEAERLWAIDGFRVKRGPAKRILSGFSDQAVKEGGKRVDARSIALGIRRDEIDPELALWIRRVEASLAD